MKQHNEQQMLTEKAFSRLMITSVLGIVVCVISLCSATWAWFSREVSSTDNTIKAGTYAADMSVSMIEQITTVIDTPQTASETQAVTADGAEEKETQPPQTETTVVETLLIADSVQDGVYRYTLAADTTYRVSISASSGGGNGYCKINVNGLETMYTNIVASDAEFNFILRLSKASPVTFELRWGTHSRQSAVADGETLEVVIPDGVQFDEPLVLSAIVPTDKETEAPSTETEAPETEVAPETEAAPETDETPETEVAPETGVASETEATTETEAAPETEATPETEETPETEAAPETDETPETEVAPETGVAPETEATPETGVAPETEATPETVEIPETVEASETE